MFSVRWETGETVQPSSCPPRGRRYLPIKKNCVWNGVVVLTFDKESERQKTLSQSVPSDRLVCRLCRPVKEGAVPYPSLTPRADTLRPFRTCLAAHYLSSFGLSDLSSVELQIWSKAWLKSSMMSSMCSVPMLKRTVEGVMCCSANSSGLICE